MSVFDEGRNEAEKLAKEHPEQADKLVEEGEQQVDERTGNKYDKQVDEAGQHAEQYLTGGAGGGGGGGGGNAGGGQNQPPANPQQGG